MRVNKLRLKPDKTEEMVVRTKPALGSGCTLMLDGVTFPPKAQVHTLGVLLDLALRLNKKATVMTRDTVHGSAGVSGAILPGKQRPGHSHMCPCEIKAQLL